MTTFPYTEVKSMSRWTNYTGTIPARAIPVYCTPDVLGDAGTGAPRRMARHGAALSAIVDHCLSSPDATLRTLGARWSLSNIIRPGQVALDPANLNVMLKVKEDWLTDSYRATRGAQACVPIFAQGGTHISSINRRLAQIGLALQTSGAGDGHRVAGCIATGTHGSALDIGAVHDTVLGLHLIVAGNDSIFVQPESRPACGPEVADWLQRETGIPTRNVMDDELFAAAQVALGSLGVVHAVILETVPLYALEGLCLARPFDDADVWRTLDDLETRRLHPEIDESPYHFEVVFHPYPATGKPAAFVMLYWKRSADGVPPDSPLPIAPDLPSDTMGLIAKLAEATSGNVATWALQQLIGSQLEARFKPRRLDAQVPGMIFGPTSLPPGQGASTEVVVAQTDARRALEILYDTLRQQAAQGHHLLGPVATRFVPRTHALLGMSQHAMSCYIELPSVRTREVGTIYTAWWDALEQDGLDFTCHWGQMHGMTPQRLERYFGDRLARWKNAQAEILPTEAARRVFASPLLAEVGLC